MCPQEQEIIKNIFLPYGCCKAPKAYQRNDDVFKHGCAKLDVFDWLKDFPGQQLVPGFEPVEVRFKNSRKEFFLSPTEIKVTAGDIVAVEASPGHDIGIISLTGPLVYMQMKNRRVDPRRFEFKKVYRKARSSDLEKWISATEQEEITKFKTRKIAARLRLDMKLNDVEYQGDRTKATFYYTADTRIDFRELIRAIAETFSIRVEMKQIGVRQEAARLGGLGPCGRELCCTTWLTSFRSVSTNHARGQQLSLNPQKLAGQCGKLKCCLQYEYDCYVDAQKDFPDTNIHLHFARGEAVHVKTDVHKRLMWYGYADGKGGIVPVSVDDVKKIIAMNRNRQTPQGLDEFEAKIPDKPQYDTPAQTDPYQNFV
ncbi:MAG TPA: regulatory iron-sulfur-containing complex subunit RicT [Bacteroidales bacterium]|nr:regulatory iron-sulfur-containing complex subunit RicT [Bacteroidales bacterium]HRZ47951.1 regulatory iron-sulfur-containing complex subunit RicT [Bacteroidales bacterium]